MPEIKFVNVIKKYNKDGPNAVDELSLEVTDGDFLCLLGPSGCGKTTTLRMLAGLEHPTSGRIVVGDRVVDNVEEGIFLPTEKRGLGMVFQSYALWPHLTVRENVEFGLRLGRNSKDKQKTHAAQVMKRLDIDRYSDRYPSELSGGQQQRVALARTLVTDPDVILMDEPLSNLDAKLRLEMRAELKRIHAESKATIVFVTHDQWEAMTLATTIAVMRAGQLEQVGTPDDIYARPRTRFVAEFVGNPPMNIIELASDSDPLVKPVSDYLTRMRGPSFHAEGSVGIRPESIQLSDGLDDHAADTFALEASLASILPTGGSWILELAVKERRLFAVTSSKPAIQEGTKVVLSMRLDELHIFDPDGLRHPD